MISLLILLLGVFSFTFSAPVTGIDRFSTTAAPTSVVLAPSVPTPKIPSYHSVGPRPTHPTRPGYSLPYIHHSLSVPTPIATQTMDPVFPGLTHSSGWGFPTIVPPNKPIRAVEVLKESSDPWFPHLTHSSGWGFPTIAPPPPQSHSTRAGGFFTGKPTCTTHAGGFLTVPTHYATWGHVNEHPKQARNTLSTKAPTTSTSAAGPTTTNENPVPAHSGVPDCNFQALPSTGILNYMIRSAHAPNAYTCQLICSETPNCQSYSYRVSNNIGFDNCEIFSVKFDGVDPATGVPLVIKWLVPLMWFSNRLPSDGSGYCYAKP